jgi:hypothetical protein
MTKTHSLPNAVVAALRLLAVVGLVFIPVFAPLSNAPAAYAQSGGPGTGGTGGNGNGNGNGNSSGGGPDTAASAITDVFFSLAEKIIAIVIMVSVAIFGVSMVFGASGAQVANLLGSPMAVSQSWMRVFTAVVTFLMVILTPMLVNLIFGMVKTLFTGSVTLPRF